MAVTIQIKHFIPAHKRALARPLLDQVRDLIRHQNGHFYTEELCAPEVSEISIENSTWSSMSAWRTWQSSREWRKAQSRIEDVLEARSEYAVVATSHR